jgi:acyl transferase domain-containing protein
MSAPATLANLSAVKLALMAQEVRAQTSQVLRADPIAIVGMACRTPGGCETPDAFWQLLATGVDATSDIPADRFDAAPWRDPDPAAAGKMQATRGGFLTRIDSFDADYFGILPREAEQMDPQQRIALETAIDAVDDAGALAPTLRGSRAGVFMASYHSDYARLVFQDPNDFDTRTLTGSVHGVVANRISHFLDLRGPSLTLDTGCSSSLVAVHLACQSLRLGESDFALAGGVSAIITPELFVAMTKVGFMAPDGRCKTFDSRADGFGRGEGCGVVALKRLSDAIADGDRIHAVIRGSAVNQDGRSTVLTAPNGQAQKSMIREALEAAAVGPERISFVEAHGTGTALGDPIEIEAIAETLGRAPGNACFVGSAKANIAHLEAAAGVIGLVKAALVLRHQTVPPQPGFGVLSPHISLDGTRLQVPTVLTPLAGGHAPICAAVSSFGIGGTNAHVVLEAAPELPVSEAAKDAVWTLPLSAKTPEGLAALGKIWIELLDKAEDTPIEDLCYTASQRRTHYPVRVAAAAKSKGVLRERLAAALDRIQSSPTRPPRIGFVFSGQGPQWWAMGRELQQGEPVFRAAMQACGEAIGRFAGWSVIDELATPEDQTRVGQTAIAQPALFAIQTSLVALWASWNIRPSALVGHSVGEIGALHAAGALSLSEAARVVVKRGLIMQAATGRGRMAAVSLSEADAQAVVERYSGRLDIAAVNGPRSVVLSGMRDALLDVLAELQAQGVEARDLQLDYAFHSAQMTDLAEAFARDLGEITRARVSTPVFSTLTGAALVGDELDGAYLARAIREPVRFADAITAMEAAGVDAFVEIGPHPVLASAIAETLQECPPRAVVASLRRGRDERDTMRSSLAALYSAGADPDWDAVQPEGGQVTTLPSYPWQRRRFWISNDDTTAATPWLGAPVNVAGADKVIVPVHPLAIRDWIQDHRIFNQTVVPGTAIIQALAAAGAVMARAQVAIEDVVIHTPLIFSSENDRWQVVGTPAGENLTLGFYAENEGGWHRIAEARTAALRSQNTAATYPDGQPVDLPAFFARLEDVGIVFGPAFRSLASAARSGDEANGRAALPPHVSADPSPHPALLDAGLQLAVLACGREGAFLPIGADRVTLDIAQHRSARLHASITSRSDVASTADIFAETENGRFVAALEGVRFVKADASQFAVGPTTEDLYAIDWVPAAAAPPVPMETSWIVLEDQAGVGGAFATAVESAEGRVLRLGRGAPADLPAELANAAVACFWPLDDGAAYDDMLALIRAYAIAGPRTFLIVVSGTCGEPSRLGRPGRQRAAGMVALVRIAALEHPDLHLRIVDIDPLASREQQVAALLSSLRSTAEPLLATRDEEIRVPRVRRQSRRKAEAMRVVQEGDGLDGIVLQSFSSPTPGPGELRVRVRAAGVNFRDTLVALGAYAGEPILGAECAGIVEAVGAGVVGFARGDRVAGLAPGCLATHALMRADLAVRLPDYVRFDTAAALPVTSVTAHIALRHFAELKSGDRVLIHAATGGVGLAAVALACRAGAEVFATAGSHQKRAFLRNMGVRHVFDSRTMDFADEIRTATGGEGVRIALNSLTGRFVGATLQTLEPEGMLLELGKREIWTSEEAAAVRPDVRYHVFDAGTMAEAEPSLFRTAMQDALDALARREMSCPPLETQSLTETPAVLRRMANARHIGKLVLTVGADDSDAVPVHADADYLITGGLGGVGLQAAAWLIRRGARRLTLIGRSAPSAQASAAIADLEKTGATVRTLQFDLSDAAPLRALMDEIGATLRGIFHAAGILADGLVLNLDGEAVDAARSGKVEGAHALRKEARGALLDFVVLCSSAAGLFGGQGQGAYAAANAELEALAQEWRSDGVNVVSVAWGPWAEGGMFVGATQGAQAAWRARGLVPMSSARAFTALDRLLAREEGHAIIADIDWDRVLAQDGEGTAQPIFADMMSRVVRATAAPRPDLAVAELRKLPPGLQESELVKLLARHVRTLLELPEDAVLSPALALKEIGLDSLLAVELRNQLARLGGTPLPATLAFDHPTLEALASHLSTVWDLASDPTSAATTARDSSIDDMSDDEAVALLESELEMLSAGRST